MEYKTFINKSRRHFVSRASVSSRAAPPLVLGEEMISFGVQKPKGNVKCLATIRLWVEDALPPTLCTSTVMVNELQCFEPGCAPIETVITLLGDGKPMTFKVFKPALEVERAETVKALEDMIANGGQAPEHLKNGENVVPQVPAAEKQVAAMETR